jgi:predicted metalloprotease with PDZ domain
MYTRALWFAEGVTNTYASYTLVRTGLWSKQQFLEDLSEQIDELELRPARRWESAEESSLNAWLEGYATYGLPQFSISYYNKGQLLGLGLDIFIRDATVNRASLDDVMRRMNQEYALRGRFYADSEGVEGVVEEVLHDAGVDKKAELNAFFSRYVAGTDELPLADWLARAGLTLESRGQRNATFGFTISRNAAGAAVVSDLDIQSDAARAGIREGDVLVSVEGSDVPKNVVRWLRGHHAGDTVHVHFGRGDSESDAMFALSEEAAHDFSVEEMPQANPRQRALWNGLLQGTTADHAQ